MPSTLNKTIKKLVTWTGLSQAKVAEAVGVSTAQLSQYLNGNASANKGSLEKLLKLEGADHQVYSNRIDLVYKAAVKLRDKGIDTKKVAGFSQEEMVKYTSLKELSVCKDVNHDELEYIINSHVSDYADTYSYVKAMIILAMGMGGKANNKAFVASLYDTSKKLMVVMAGGDTASPIAAVRGILGLEAASVLVGPAVTSAILLGSTIAGETAKITQHKCKSLDGIMNTSALQLALQLTKKQTND